MKLWGGRFSEEEDHLMEEFNASIEEDKVFYDMDIIGSIAHVKGLEKSNLLTEKEAELLVRELENISTSIQKGEMKIDGGYEDIHSFVEAKLTEKLGDLGKKLHTARSRNDQVALDLKLYAKRETAVVMEAIDLIINSLEDKANDNQVLMPGYTHMQRAQVITFGYHLKAYVEMFKRDKKRLHNAIELMNENPLGCGALAGTTHQIDRDYVTELLGFHKSVENFMDGVSDRDYFIELLSALSTIMMHLSRLSEEIILWSSQEFAFVVIDDAYSTGSSIMPHKKNPDAAELIRGRTGKVYGALFTVLTIMKGIPLAYNKDMQEVKTPLFESMDTVLSSLKIMSKMIATLKVNKDKMEKAINSGFLNATEVADYLVSKGIPFRDAHSVVGEIVIHCEKHSKSIEALTLDELKQFNDDIQNDIYGYINYHNILKRGNKKEIIKQ